MVNTWSSREQETLSMATRCDTSDSDSESDTDLRGSPKWQKIGMGKTRYGGASKYKTKFKGEWTKTWPFIAAIPGDPYSMRCNVCSKT